MIHIKNKRRLNIIWFTRITIILSIAVFITLFVFIALKDKPQVDEEFYAHSDKYNLDHSDFYKYQGKIYTSVIGKGYLPIPEADVSTFQVFAGNLHIPQIGWDKSHIFFTNKIVPLQQPFRAIGNDLFTDEKDTYYCPPYPEFKNGSSSQPMRKVGKTGQHFSASTTSAYLSTDGTHFYYQGEKIEGAKDTLFPILDLRDRNDRSYRKSYSPYFSDGKRVFYKTQLLDETFSDDLVAEEFSNRGSYDYLYHLNGGKVFIGNTAFLPSEAPYQLLIDNHNYSDHLFFVNKQGVYYYDTMDEKVKKVIDNNPFEGCKEIEEGIFSNGKKTLFFLCKESWSRKSGSISYSTQICSLKSNLSPSEIKNKIKNKDLNKQEYEVLGEAKTYTQSLWERYLLLWVIIVSSIFAYITHRIFKYYNITIDPFILEEKHLRINNLIGKRYLISDIRKVVFEVNKKKIAGQMYIVSKKEGTSRDYLVSTGSLVEKENALIEKIKDLQQLLESRNIKTECNQNS